MVRASAVLAVVVALAAWYAAVGAVPDFPLWADVAVTALALIPATFALVWLALPWHTARWALAAGVASAVAVFALDWAGLDAAANFGKLAATTLLGWWFLSYFERLSWVVIVAAIIPLVDSISVWRGPTRHIVEERPEVFGALSYAFPVPDGGSFQLGLPDLLFFALFLGAAARWALRVPATWLALVASFGATMTLAIYVDPLDLGGLPALPLLAVGFLAANADLLWRRLRGRVAVAGVDAYRGGWIAVILGGDGSVRAHACRDFAEVRRLPVDVIAVDIPIGEGPREADVEARRLVGARASSVFPTPPRAVLEAETYDEALALARELTGAGVTRQAYGLRRRILEVDAHAARDPRVIEVHPELSFRELAGDALTHSKRTPEGIAERRLLLERAGIEPPSRPAGVPEADLLDAAAAAWTAARYARAAAEPLPAGHGERLGAIWR